MNTDNIKRISETVRIILGIFLLILLWYFVSALLFYFPVGEKVANGITREKILSLRIGMDKSDIINILGFPINTYKSSSGDYLIYATPGLLGAGFEINVKIDQNKLVGIYIEESDLGVYFCDKNKCPGILKPDKFNKLISGI